MDLSELKQGLTWRVAEEKGKQIIRENKSTYWRTQVDDTFAWTLFVRAEVGSNPPMSVMANVIWFDCSIAAGGMTLEEINWWNFRELKHQMDYISESHLTD